MNDRPAYVGLTNNVSTPLMKLKDHPWPPGTEHFVNHKVLAAYIQSAAESFGVKKSILFNTRVERIWKEDNMWRVQSSKLSSDRNGLSLQRHIEVRPN